MQKRFANACFQKSIFIQAFQVLFVLFFLPGCSLSTSASPDLTMTPSPSGTMDVTEEVTAFPEAPTSTPFPSVTPSAGNYTPETAAERIRHILEDGSYDISMLSDSLTIDSDQYYTFLVSQKGSAMEPLIIVNQKTGELKCISSDNVVSDISAHPLYQEQTAENIFWKGAYLIVREDGTVSNYIVLSPVDAAHFEFTVYAYLESGAADLSGIAATEGNRATFTSKTNVVLHFTLSDAKLVIEQESESEEACFSGEYRYTENADFIMTQITKEEALNKLLSIPAEQSGLTGDINDYLFYVQDKATIINDHLCYGILVYTESGNRLFYKTQYYISVDGNRIYGLEASDDDEAKIFSIQ